MHAAQARILQYLTRRPAAPRRPIRFSMRTLLVLVTLCGLAAGAYTIFVQSHIREFQREQATLAELQKLGVVVDFAKRAHGARWLKAWRGGEYARRVDQIAVKGSAASAVALAKLHDFSQLGHVRIQSGQKISAAAFVHLVRHPTLRSLTLVNTHVAATGTQALRRSNLTSLHLATDATEYDAAWIGNLAQLRYLSIDAPIVDADLEAIGRLNNLERLTIRSDRVTDAGLAHLAGLSGLERLELECPITDAGMAHLATLPKLKRLHCRPDSQSARLVDELTKSVQPLLFRSPFADAVNTISSALGLPARIDHDALKESNVSLDDVTLMVHRKRPLRIRKALDSMLAPHGLGYVFEPDRLVITTEEEAARRRPGTTRLLEANPDLEAYVPW